VIKWFCIKTKYV